MNAIMLNAALMMPDRGPGERPDRHRPAAPKTILIAEDDEIIRMIARESVTEAGFIAVDVPDATAALDIMQCRGDDIDILFTDIHMPGGINGLELARQVKSRWPHVKVLVASGNIWPKSTELPSESRFLRKPYRLDDVVQELKALAA